MKLPLLRKTTSLRRWLLGKKTVNAPQTKVTYRYILWFLCVKRLTLNEDVAMGLGLASMFRKYAFGYVAGAAAIICLNNSNRWDVS